MKSANDNWNIRGTTSVALTVDGRPAFIASHSDGCDLWVYHKKWWRPFKPGVWKKSKRFSDAVAAFRELGILTPP